MSLPVNGSTSVDKSPSAATASDYVAAPRERQLAEWLIKREGASEQKHRLRHPAQHTSFPDSNSSDHIFPNKFASIIKARLDAGPGEPLEIPGRCENADRLRDAINRGFIGVWEWSLRDASLRACDVSKAAFGRSAEQVLTWQDVIAAIHPEDQARWYHATQFVLRSGRDYRGGFRAILPDGSQRWLDLSTRTLLNERGAVEAFLGMCVDNTANKVADLAVSLNSSARSSDSAVERIVAERTSVLTREFTAREQAREQMQQIQKMETIGQLTGGVAHDFNNMLTAVMGNLDMLRRRLPKDPRLARLVDGAMLGVERGATLTQRLLAYSRRQSLNTGPINLVSLFERLRGVLSSLVSHDIGISIAVPDKLPPALADEPQLELAILNLALNARDAMPAGGQIDIAITQVPAVEGDVAVHGYIEIAVSDTGIGMSPQVLARAIDPFFSTKPVGQGTGLGLSMVHGLAHQLGGSLNLSSSPSSGTTAILRIPACGDVAVRGAAAVSATPVDMRASILFVDDDPLVAASTVGMLQDLGHRVISATSGEEAFHLLRGDQPIDLLMTDYSMPGMNGMELANLSMEVRPELPVLVATGYADVPTGLRQDFPRLNKPYDIRQLQLRLQEMLGRPQELRNQLADS